MTEHDETLSVGELQAALSNAIVRIMRDFYGKGAARSRTTIFDEYVFVVLEDVLTTAEMTLRNGGAGELVRKVRMRFEDVMTATFVGEVERLTGRTVVAYHSQVVLDPPELLRDLRARPHQEGIGRARARRRAGRGGRPPGARAGRRRRSAALAGRAVRAAERRAETGASQRLGAGAVRAAISNAVMRLTNELYGTGGRADAHLHHRRARLLRLGGGADARSSAPSSRPARPSSCASCAPGSCEMVRPVFAAEVARLLGRQVLAMESQLVFDPDTLFLIFVLGDGRAPEPAAAAGEIADANGL